MTSEKIAQNILKKLENAQILSKYSQNTLKIHIYSQISSTTIPPTSSKEIKVGIMLCKASNHQSIPK